MTRDEAAAMLEEWRNADVNAWMLRGFESSDVGYVKADALKARILDAMTGEEATQPLAGNAP